MVQQGGLLVNKLLTLIWGIFYVGAKSCYETCLLRPGRLISQTVDVHNSLGCWCFQNEGQHLFMLVTHISSLKWHLDVL